MTSLVIYGAINHQKDNISSPQGGAADFSKKLMTGAIPNLAQVQLTSQSALDTGQTYLVEGIGSTRAIESETIQLNGTALVITERSFSRLCSITKQSGATLSGDVTAISGTTILGIMNIQAGLIPETEELVNFLANAQGRATVDSAFYEKLFIRNTTGAVINTLTITEHQSDSKGRVFFAADTVLDSASTSNNRLTKPGSISPGDFSTDTPIVINSIPDGESVSVWLRMLIPAGEGTVLYPWKVKLVADSISCITTLLHSEGQGGTLIRTLSERENHPIGGGNPLRYVELKGAKFVQQIFYEPDPITFRDQFYYNTRLNRLFKKINSKPNPVWKIVR